MEHQTQSGPPQSSAALVELLTAGVVYGMTLGKMYACFANGVGDSGAPGEEMLNDIRTDHDKCLHMAADIVLGGWPHPLPVEAERDYAMVWTATQEVVEFADLLYRMETPEKSHTLLPLTWWPKCEHIDWRRPRAVAEDRARLLIQELEAACTAE